MKKPPLAVQQYEQTDSDDENQAIKKDLSLDKLLMGVSKQIKKKKVYCRL